jgi:small GTP-binding protein
MSYNDVLKVVLIGESGSGKTSIIQRFSYNLFDPNCASSISSQYISKIIELKDINQTLKFDIWDTAGQEKYRSMAKLFYKDAKIILFVYDITSLKSFNEIKSYWISQVQQNCEPNALLGVVANKNDLYNMQQVPKEEGIKLADEIGAIFQMTSAKSGIGINNLFENIGRKYLDPKFDYQAADKIAEEKYKKRKEKEQMSKKKNERKRGVKLDVKNEKEKKGGCCG